MNTKQLQAVVPAALSSDLKMLDASSVNPLTRFVYQGFTAHSVQLRKNEQDIHGRTLADKAVAECDEVIVRFKRRLDQDAQGREASSDLPPASSTSAVSILKTDEEEIVDAYRKAAEGRKFVSIKWFRDVWVPSSSISLAKDTERVHRALALAIDRDMLRKERIANPNDPEHPTTVLKEGVGSSGPAIGRAPRRFNPVEIKGGKPLSQTVLEGR
jgi:hypothetical protein